MSATPNIRHITAEEVFMGSFRLGKKLYQKGLRPHHAISIWRGGTPVGLELLHYTSSVINVSSRKVSVDLQPFVHIRKHPAFCIQMIEVDFIFQLHFETSHGLLGKGATDISFEQRPKNFDRI